MNDSSANALRLPHRFAGPPDLLRAVQTRPWTQPWTRTRPRTRPRTWTRRIRFWFGASHGSSAHGTHIARQRLFEEAAR
jgi:hypothetical protein